MLRERYNNVCLTDMFCSPATRVVRRAVCFTRNIGNGCGFPNAAEFSKNIPKNLDKRSLHPQFQMH